jgi:transcriptional regulator with XRE-family HTH domain
MPTPDDVRVYNAAGFGRAIRHFREQAGLTQAQLAGRVGVHRSYLAEIEAGKLSEQTRRIIALLKAADARIVVTRADW